MKHSHGLTLGVLALTLQCGCMNSSVPTSPTVDAAAREVPPVVDASMSFRTASHGGHMFMAGVADDFAAPLERPAPSAALTEFAARYWPQDCGRQFDSPGFEYALIHTFTGWNFPVRGAVLELHLRAESGASENDSVRLGLVGGPNTVTAFRWWMTIHKVTGTWPQGAETTLRLDLANLPEYSTFPTNILSELQDGSLELMVEDDTAVDYARLVLTSSRKGDKPVAIQVPLSSSAR